MKKIFWVLGVFGAIYALDLQQINKDINLNQQKIQKKENEKNQITNLLQKLGNEINNNRRKIRDYHLQILRLQENINSNQGKNLNEEKILEQYKNLLKQLQDQKQEIRQKIVKILINDASFLILLNEKNPTSPDDIILQEMFKSLGKQSQEKILLLTDQENLINQKIQETTEGIQALNASINLQMSKKKSLQKILSEQKALEKTLHQDLSTYNKKLEQINNERKSLDLILSNLNILKQNTQRELEEKRKQQEKEVSIKKSQKKDSIIDAPLEVKQVANSYKMLSTAKYKGKKTIAPLENFTVEQKFGTYFDPVYKLKVFNEAVILVSKTPNAVVRSIFDGKVVYAKEVPILKKVVIIENKEGMHTIYSQLDKIAPTIKVGLKIQKGYIIGRVEQKLSFEITQKDKHIDPLEVISQKNQQ
ncbi:murein hydrolase activator EnvC family protein [Helicobacter mustelae]|uniref:Putative metallopeptidase n=1 Tax=Helicobacter mustelae (strain ATCC 43772 / CCUG 25715 / CIP 103759 / LMG 18044 / NCTC 12198 / R85-136P) TaxID=679897 RepID=D3UGM7_HELM1|nr:peptidoglycan DD-metalloendopeptidase family protein [Helicobacter mustelae]CBG39648.1 putative metallopeptidase [Helicobacter mustelae 12198]SQH71159.1 metallopeptidase [Helicobacter mustelae]